MSYWFAFGRHARGGVLHFRFETAGRQNISVQFMLLSDLV